MYPITDHQIDAMLEGMGVNDIGQATIRQICSLASNIENVSNEEVVHLEIGNPGIPASAVGVEAECAALRSGVANKYPDIAGIKPLKQAAVKFIKAFFNEEADERCIIPTVGSMQGTFTVLLLLTKLSPEKDTVLFLNPGFPAQRTQAHIVGFKESSFDIYDYRGAKLEGKLDEMLGGGNIAAIVYSNPNNPAWTNLTEEELEIIGKCADRHDVIVMEDLAYMGMDFRRDFGQPGVAPFIPTVSRYTDRYIQFMSASKIFSYAGQRISLVNFSPKVADIESESIKAFYHNPTLLNAYIFGVLYAASSGTAHSAQHALAAMLDAAAEGRLNFVDDCTAYKHRCQKAKKIFLDNGFHLVYDKDGEEPVSDGFFFTAGYGDMTSQELQRELLRYGVATISLPSTGSLQNGLRICPSMLDEDRYYDKLAQRLKLFHDAH